MQNYQAPIIREYGNSPSINQLITNFNSYIDPTANLDAFYSNMWNVETATGYGLDVWGRIVGVSRVLAVATLVYLGATGPSGTSGDSMNVASFYSGETTTSNFALADDPYRTLIFAKALFNISDGSIGAINNILMTLFGSQGQCWVVDNLNMSMVYYFNFTLDPVSSSIVYQSGVLPRPSGIIATVTQA